MHLVLGITYNILPKTGTIKKEKALLWFIRRGRHANYSLARSDPTEGAGVASTHAARRIIAV